MILLEQVVIDARLGVEALDEPGGHHLDQVLVAGVIFAEQHKMVGGGIDLVLLIEAGARRDIDLAPDDRLDPRLFGGLVKVDRAEHHAVVG